jgi:DNA-binding transcriptional LysR family regulator
MDRLDCIQSFVRVVETGSFSAVAKEYNTTQPTISKQIAALEAHLDVQLLARSTRKLQLTQEGERFFEHCQSLLDAAAEAEASVGQRQKPSGSLRISCSIAFGQYQIIPCLKGFLDHFPDIKLDLKMGDHYVDLIAESVDLAIRVGQFADPNLIAQRIGMTRSVTVAGTAYFQHRQEPETPQDLVDHNCIIHSRLATGNEWKFQLPNGRTTQVIVSGNVQVDNVIAVREAVLSGLGIAVCPVWLFSDLLHSDRLKLLLKECQPTSRPIYAVYRRGRFIPARVRCFIEYLAKQFKSNPYLSE